MTLAILPVKLNSERVHNKNFRPVGEFELGIFEIKFKQLIDSESISSIMITSDYQAVLKIAAELYEKYNSTKSIHYHLRPKEYSGSCPNHEWVAYLSTQIRHIEEEDVMLCFATSPFFDEEQIDLFYTSYSKSNYDSMAVASKLQTYIWRDGKPFNYDKGWPITQSLSPVYVINSSAFLCKKDAFIKTQDRLHGNVGFFESTWINSCVNIDYPNDFENFLLLWDSYKNFKR